jgi:hypothetical protein
MVLGSTRNESTSGAIESGKTAPSTALRGPGKYCVA